MSKNKLNIPEFKLEELLDGFDIDSYQNHKIILNGTTFHQLEEKSRTKGPRFFRKD